MLLAIVIYFLLLFVLARLTHRRGSTNETFFSGERRSPWGVVTFGMIGASISGVTFIGVPGWAITTDMTYLQMCLGFILGYAVVAFVLLPIYYRFGYTSIYTYLANRIGRRSHATGASFFLLSKLLGSAAKFYVVVEVLQLCIAETYGIPYAATASITLLLIWLYTRHSGIKTLVWTDALQTFVLLTALILILTKTCNMLDFSAMEAVKAVWHDSHSRVFEWNDMASKQYFWKQFISGAFVVIVMTGLDQDMMQKNLTCKNLRSAQWDMCTYGVTFVPVNLLFLSLGVLLMMLYGRLGMEIPARGDDLLSGIVLSGVMGEWVKACFCIGVVASALSSADSAMTALTTSMCVDIMKKENDVGLRKRIHLGVMIALLCCTIAFHELNDGSVMDLIYTLVSYTYGPLLGLFAFGLCTKRGTNEKFVPLVCVLSPIICYVIDLLTLRLCGYKFGYEILMLNGLFTFIGLWIFPSEARCGK